MNSISIPDSERTLTSPIDEEIDTKRSDQLMFLEFAKSLLDTPWGLGSSQYSKMIEYMNLIGLKETDLGEVKKAQVTESYHLLFIKG